MPPGTTGAALCPRLPLDANTLLIFRLAFLAVLYLFLVIVARAAWQSLRTPAGRDETPTREFIVLDPARSRWRKGERILVPSGASVGRDAGNTVVVDEDTVSAQHAVLRRENGRWWIEDLASTNGTFINKQRIEGRRPLADGDEVHFGRVAVRFGAAGGSARGGSATH